MSGVIHFGRAARALTVSTLSLLALSLLPGCANRGDVARMDDASQDEYSGIVSAREYGYVRPAREGRLAGRSVNRSGSGDVWGRVRTGMKLDLHAHARIDGTLERFRRDPRYLERLSQQASPYLPTIVAEIEKRGFPMELALLPHVESRYNPNATSPKAAGGMWQFMPYTAREMGLRLDSEYDERRDVVASTRAALDYLAQINQRFNGDWELTMAAYNCGPARVEAAREANILAGRPTDFWSLDLPNETRQYVPQILATARLVADSGKYGQRLLPIADRPMQPAESSRLAIRVQQRTPSVSLDQDKPTQSAAVSQELAPPRSRRESVASRPAKAETTAGKTAKQEKAAGSKDRQSTVAASKVHQVKPGEHLTAIARRYGVDARTLADWNGLSFNEPLLPGQTLRLGADKIADKTARTTKTAKTAKTEAPALVTHQVKKGDSITAIARRYGVTIDEIKRWNKIASNQVNVGDTIRVYRQKSSS